MNTAPASFKYFRWSAKTSFLQDIAEQFGLSGPFLRGENSSYRSPSNTEKLLKENEYEQ